MAEVVGTIASAVTLAMLFKSCIDAFDIIRTAHNQESDLRKLVLKLNLEKCRLYTWGESIGLTKDQGEQMPTATCQFHSVMVETLEMLLQLFEDSERLQKTYGCKQFLDAPYRKHALTRPEKHLEASFGNFRFRGKWRHKGSKMVSQAKWAIHDRQKFMDFVSDIKDYVDGLQHITKTIVPPSVQENTVTQRIETLDDVDTLDILSEICQEDHPDVARAASDRAETLSMTTTTRWRIEHWDCTETAPEATTTGDLEDLSITELRHHVFHIAKERRELEMQLQWFQNVFMKPEDTLSRSADGLFPNTAKFRKALLELKMPVLPVLPPEWEGVGPKHLLQVSKAPPTVIGLGLTPTAARAIPMVSHSALPSASILHDPRFNRPAARDAVYDQSNSADPDEQRPIGYIIEEDAEQEESFSAAREHQESSPATKHQPAADHPSCHESTVKAQKENPATTTDSKSERWKVQNGFQNWNFLASKDSAAATHQDDYFVLSFDIPRPQLHPALYDCMGHSHYANAQYIAKVVHRKRYQPFDLKTWPRELQITGTVSATSLNDTWARELQKYNFQVHVFAIPVESFIVCSAPQGGCLHTLFDVLGENEQFAICQPAHTNLQSGRALTPQVYIAPLATSGYPLSTAGVLERFLV